MDRKSIHFKHSDDLPLGVLGSGGGFGTITIDLDRTIHYSFDPSAGAITWTAAGKLLTRPTAISIPIWIYDPKRKCISSNDFTNGDTSFIEPSNVMLFNWNTLEKYKFHSPKWEGKPAEPMIRQFYKVADSLDDLCPRDWFYFARPIIYLKYVDEKDKTSRRVGISTKDVGIIIEFENGDQLVWNLSEIYPEFSSYAIFW